MAHETAQISLEQCFRSPRSPSPKSDDESTGARLDSESERSDEKVNDEMPNQDKQREERPRQDDSKPETASMILDRSTQSARSEGHEAFIELLEDLGMTNANSLANTLRDLDFCTPDELFVLSQRDLDQLADLLGLKWGKKARFLRAVESCRESNDQPSLNTVIISKHEQAQLNQIAQTISTLKGTITEMWEMMERVDSDETRIVESIKATISARKKTLDEIESRAIQNAQESSTNLRRAIEEGISLLQFQEKQLEEMTVQCNEAIETRCIHERGDTIETMIAQAMKGITNVEVPAKLEFPFDVDLIVANVPAVQTSFEVNRQSVEAFFMSLKEVAGVNLSPIRCARGGMKFALRPARALCPPAPKKRSSLPLERDIKKLSPLTEHCNRSAELYRILNIDERMYNWSEKMRWWLREKVIRLRVNDWNLNDVNVNELFQYVYTKFPDAQRDLSQFQTSVKRGEFFLANMGQMQQMAEQLKAPQLTEIILKRKFIVDAMKKICSSRGAFGYMQSRLAFLASNSADVLWNRGGRFEGKDWSKKNRFPSDSQLMMGMFAQFMDDFMYPVEFTDKYLIRCDSFSRGDRLDAMVKKHCKGGFTDIAIVEICKHRVEPESRGRTILGPYFFVIFDKVKYGDADKLVRLCRGNEGSPSECNIGSSVSTKYGAMCPRPGGQNMFHALSLFAFFIHSYMGDSISGRTLRDQQMFVDCLSC